MSSSIVKKKLLNGVLWNTIEKIVVKGTSFFIGIVLARLLSPEDYGLLGMLAIFISLSQIFIESGFARALIQKKDCNDVDYSTVFYTNIVISIFVYIVMFCFAPLVSKFYEEPILKDLLRVISVNVILGSFNIVQRAKLMANVDFKSLAKINFWGTFFGGIVGIGLAYWGFGVWALVAQTISSTIIMMFLFPLFSNWKPIWIFSFKSFKTLFGFGSKLLATGVVSVIFNNISTLAIGKYYNSAQLGYYTRAVQFSTFISTILYEVIGTVTFPVLSQLQEQEEQMVAVYKRALYYTFFVTAPIMVLLTLLAKPLIVVLLTEKWLPAVVLLQILCIARLFTPLSAINMNILNAIGRSDLFMKVDFIKLPMQLIILLITIPMGLKAIVIGELVGTAISFFINAYYPGRLYGYGAIKQILDWRKIIVAVVIMTIPVLLILQNISNLWLQLIIGSLSGILTYLFVCLILGVINKTILKELKK